jgi:multidrug efflux pump subunit AcrB
VSLVHCGVLVGVVAVVILLALPLVAIGAFTALAVTGHALDLSALISMLMLRSIVVTNAIVLRDLAQHKIETGADVRMVLTQGGRTHVHPTLMRGRVGTWPSGSNRWPGRR